MFKSMLLVTAVIAAIFFTLHAANASCIIKLYKTSATSKTAYTKTGESIGINVRKKLSSQCAFKIRLMSLSEKRSFDIARLRKRLAKLGAK